MSASPSQRPVCTVFVSYSNPDKQVADRICEELERAGVKCWIAPRDIVPGDSWSTAIVGAIDRSDVMVIVFSSRTLVSIQVMRELDLADVKRLPVIPIRLENVEPTAELRYYLGNRQWLDAVGPQRESLIPALLQAVRAHIPYEELPKVATPTVVATVASAAHWEMTPDAALEFAGFLLDQDRFEEAIAQLEPPIQAHYAEAYNLRGWARKKLQHYDRAIQDYDEAIRLEPNYARAFLNRGIARHHLNQDELAIQDFNEAIGIRPDYAQAYFRRGLSYRNLQQYQRAIEDLTESIRLSPDSVQAFSLRSECRAALGDQRGAEADLQKARQAGGSVAGESS